MSFISSVLSLEILSKFFPLFDAVMALPILDLLPPCYTLCCYSTQLISPFYIHQNLLNFIQFPVCEPALCRYIVLNRSSFLYTFICVQHQGIWISILCVTCHRNQNGTERTIIYQMLHRQALHNRRCYCYGIYFSVGIWQNCSCNAQAYMLQVACLSMSFML